MDNNQKFIYYKYALVGDSSVGKELLFKKLSKGDFSEKNISTIGSDKRTISFTNLDVEDFKGNKIKKSFEISLFDTAGQERFRSISKRYFKDSQGIILIYDITNRITFDHLEMWLSSIKEALSDWESSNYMIMILGNKLDLVNNNERKREVFIEEVEKKYRNSGIFIGGECSLKEFSDSQILEIIKNFTVKIFNKI